MLSSQTPLVPSLDHGSNPCSDPDPHSGLYPVLDPNSVFLYPSVPSKTPSAAISGAVLGHSTTVFIQAISESSAAPIMSPSAVIGMAKALSKSIAKVPCLVGSASPSTKGLLWLGFLSPSPSPQVSSDSVSPLSFLDVKEVGVDGALPFSLLLKNSSCWQG